MSETLTMANPIETEKIRTHHAKIVIECTTGKPYYSIEWYDPAKQEYFLGYSSYNIENVLGWLSECFEIVEATKTNADRIRAMTDEELAWELMTWRIETEAKHQGVESNYPNTQKAILEWLQAPAEGE